LAVEDEKDLSPVAATDSFVGKPGEADELSAGPAFRISAGGDGGRELVVLLGSAVLNLSRYDPPGVDPDATLGLVPKGENDLSR